MIKLALITLTLFAVACSPSTHPGATGDDDVDAPGADAPQGPPADAILVTAYGATGDGSTDDGAAIQAAVNACGAGGTVWFSPGTYAVTTRIDLVANCTYTAAAGTANVQGHTGTDGGGFPIFGLSGSDITISNLVFIGGGIEISGSPSHLTITGNTIRDILNTTNAGPDSGPAQVGIYQDAANGEQITSSSIDHNQLRNIYGPGELTCDGAWPSGGGQPCEFGHDGMDFHSLGDVSIVYNTFDSISGDGLHIFNSISCADYYHTGPGAAQPNIAISHNTIRNDHRIPLEIQLCQTTNFTLDSNYLTGTYQPSAWALGISFASEGTGARITNNYVDGATSIGTSGGNNYGACYEVGGDGTLVDGNFCTSKTGPDGFDYYGGAVVVMQNAELISNNTWCGPFQGTVVGFEPPCTNPGVTCQPFVETNNVVQSASCVGFPAPSATVGSGG